MFLKGSLKKWLLLLVFDEGKESADIAKNENILLLDEYSKVKLFEYLLQ
jgi:hypothetical protein